MFRAVGFPVDRSTWSCSASWGGASLTHDNFGPELALIKILVQISLEPRDYSSLLQTTKILQRQPDIDQLVLNGKCGMFSYWWSHSIENYHQAVISRQKPQIITIQQWTVACLRGEFSASFHQSITITRVRVTRETYSSGRANSSNFSFLFVTSRRSTCLRVLTNITRATWCCTGSRGTDWGLLSRSRRR